MDYFYVVKVFDVGVILENVFYFVMEYVCGMGLMVYCNSNEFFMKE